MAPKTVGKGATAHSPEAVQELLRGACEESEADYAILWQPDGETFRQAGSYNTQLRKDELKEQRGDDETFCTKSGGMSLGIDGGNIVAKAYNGGKSEFIKDVQDAMSFPPGSFQRGSLAREFNIHSVACVQHEGGILEYGTRKVWSVQPAPFKDFQAVKLLVDETKPTGDPAKAWRLTYWEPEDKAFWNEWGKKIAWKNLIISIPNLCLAFATWIMWSIVVTTVQGVNDKTGSYPFADLGLDPTDSKGYKATLFMLPSIAGLAGATLRVVNSFMVLPTGGKTTNAMNSTLAILPMIGIGLAFSSSDCPFWLLCILAPCCGFGGGAFASSMSGISFFFPKANQGVALGLNAGLGNLGVSITQLVLPQMASAKVFGIAAVGGKYVMNCGWFYVILLALAAAPAWLFMNYMPNHGSKSMVTNVLAYLRIQGLGFVGVITGAGLFILTTPLVAGSPALVIIRIFVLAFLSCIVTLVALRYGASPEIKEKLIVQSAIFKDKHTWFMTWLYIMTFGSFIGYSNVFPKLIKDVFGYLPDGSENPNAPDVKAFAWMGACVGSLSRPVGGWLSDKLGQQGGAIVTHWGTIIQITATVAVGIIVRIATNSETPETLFVPFLLCFLVLFGATGSSNGSTFRSMGFAFPPEKAGPVLGWTSAVAAYGAAVFPACFGAGLKGDFIDIVFYCFAFYYFTCLVLNYWYYYRTSAEKPC